MSVLYKPVQWNRSKVIYDAVLLLAVTLYLLMFLKVAPMLGEPGQAADTAVVRMRAFGSCAFLMLTLILCIGPLARLDRRFLPLLYNRRHFGVLTFIVALAHASFVLGWYFAFSPTDPYVALLSSNTSYRQLLGFPFEAFGIFVLFVLLLLAITSHDFWLKFLKPPVWKALHMAVYFAYAAVLAHVAFGYLQDNKGYTFAIIVCASAMLVALLHVTAGMRGREQDMAPLSPAAEDANWLDAGHVGEIAADRAKTILLPNGEKVAIFRHGGNKLSALTNACAHQNGPLGEGRIVGGCVTCPWHGFQYRPEDGRAPAPFTEKISTYRLRLVGTKIFLDPQKNPPGTYVEPVTIP